MLPILFLRSTSFRFWTVFLLLSLTCIAVNQILIPKHEVQQSLLTVASKQTEGDQQQNFEGTRSRHPLESNNPQAKQHIVFLKVHKAASSTLQNVFQRYALENNLNLLMPTSTYGVHINESGTDISKHSLVPASGKNRFMYDILCQHIVFDKKIISNFFPEDTVYVGVIREPFSQFVSAFKYYSQVWREKDLVLEIHENPDDPIAGFLDNLDYHSMMDPRSSKWNNRISVDFGFPVTNFEAAKRNVSLIQEFIKDIESKFTIILVSELFEESMVMLRRLLGWSTKDIISLHKNTASQHRKGDSGWAGNNNVSESLMAKFKTWAPIDLAFYSHFNGLFQERLQAQPPDFHQEVEEFKQLQLVIAPECDSLMSGVRTEYKHPATKYSSGFTLTKLDCFRMTLNEGQLTNIVKHEQMKRYFQSTHSTAIDRILAKMNR